MTNHIYKQTKCLIHNIQSIPMYISWIRLYSKHGRIFVDLICNWKHLNGNSIILINSYSGESCILNRYPSSRFELHRWKMQFTKRCNQYSELTLLILNCLFFAISSHLSTCVDRCLSCEPNAILTTLTYMQKFLCDIGIASWDISIDTQLFAVVKQVGWLSSRIPSFILEDCTS